MFATFGYILSVTIYRNQDKPFAVVIFSNLDDSERARMALNGCVFMGRKIRFVTLRCAPPPAQTPPRLI